MMTTMQSSSCLFRKMLPLLLLLLLLLLQAERSHATSRFDDDESPTTGTIEQEALTNTTTTTTTSLNTTITNATPAATTATTRTLIAGEDNQDEDCMSWTLSSKRRVDFNDRVHKTKYRVAIDSIHGDEETIRQYNDIFATYLTATAGRQFHKANDTSTLVNIEFEMIPMHSRDVFQAAQDGSIDFVYADPGIYSCLGVEVGAAALTTTISRLEVRGITYDLDVYGGVIVTRADNKRIRSIEDLNRGVVIAADDVAMLMSAQMQFYEMQKHGIDYIMDPDQVIFLYNQGKVVQGVLDGSFDVGLVRTDQIELSRDEHGNLMNPDLFHVLDPKTHVLESGYVFPFLHTTPVAPEWPVIVLEHVDWQVAEEVQQALLDFKSIVDAFEEQDDICEGDKDLAQLVAAVSKRSHIHGFRSPRSYHDVRTIQQNLGFMIQKEFDDDFYGDDNDESTNYYYDVEMSGKWHCTHSDTLYEGVTCPPQHYKLPLEEFEQSCAKLGLKCPEGADCYCKPCIKAHEVDVYEVTKELSELEEQHDNLSLRNQGCSKMSLCGSVEQTKVITFHILDNVKRQGAKVSVKVHLATTTTNIQVVQLEDYLYQFEWSARTTGVAIMEIAVDGHQIPESPIRVQVEDRHCDVDFPGEHKENDEVGNCICKGTTMTLGGKCVESVYIAVSISVFVVIIVSTCGYFYIRHRTIKSDQLWHVDLDELQFDDPVEVIGQGSFGVVLLAEYRGTKVALKRAIRVRGKGSSRGSRQRRTKEKKKKNLTDSASGEMDSVGVSSLGSMPPTDDSCADLEAGAVDSSPDSQESNPGTTSMDGSPNLGNQSQFNLSFLVRDFGRRNFGGWSPWRKKNFRNRFNETILNSSAGSSSFNSKTWHDALCPWFSAHSKAQLAFIAEMRVLSRLRHPCITTVMGAVLSGHRDPMLVMEFMQHGSLKDLLLNETMYLTGDIIMQICRDLAQGLRFLHASRPLILHGDLKARNILIDARFRAKLCDFGLSTKKQNVITGTPYWMAPEYLRGETDYTAECDIFSVGIVIYEIYSRSDPYKGEDFRETIRKICDRRINKRPPVPETCPPKLADLMKKCLAHDPSLRPQSKALDTLLLDMSLQDAEPLVPEGMVHQKPTGDMLYQLFPKHIADALKNGEKVEPEQHDEVTVIFSDIVHFTDISRMTTPLKVSNMLDRLYLAFDKVARKHNVFKVETIGDAYMGVTNLEKNQNDTHAKNAALFAIDLIVEASKVLIDDEDPGKGYINIRVGFHSGPVVSNVIGSLNPRYGLFGDTVNTASRMESNSKANRILCSESAFKILMEQAPDISAKKRGRIAVKGKGEMDVYWIGLKEVASGTAYDPIQAELDLAAKEKRVAFQESFHAADQEQEIVDPAVWRKNLKHKLEEMGEYSDHESTLKHQGSDLVSSDHSVLKNAPV